MFTHNDPIGRLTKWRLRFSEFEHDILYRPGLVHEERNAFSRLLHPSHTQTCEPADDDNHTIESSPIATGKWLNEMEVLGTPSWDNSFETIHELTRYQTAVHTPVYDNLDKYFNPNDWIIEACEPQSVDDLAVLLSTLELLKE